MMTEGFSHQVTNNKTLVKQFYQGQPYSAKLKGFDQLFITSNQDKVAAALMISRIDKSSPQMLLHGLYVEKQFRGKQLASQLLQFAISQMEHRTDTTTKAIVCFADKSLAPLYLAANFTPSSATQLTESLAARYNSYLKKQPKLNVFLYSLI